MCCILFLLFIFYGASLTERSGDSGGGGDKRTKRKRKKKDKLSSRRLYPIYLNLYDALRPEVFSGEPTARGSRLFPTCSTLWGRVILNLNLNYYYFHYYSLLEILG